MFAITFVLLMLEAVVALGFNVLRHKSPQHAKAFMPIARIVIVLALVKNRSPTPGSIGRPY